MGGDVSSGFDLVWRWASRAGIEDEFRTTIARGGDLNEWLGMVLIQHHRGDGLLLFDAAMKMNLAKKLAKEGKREWILIRDSAGEVSGGGGGDLWVSNCTDDELVFD